MGIQIEILKSMSLGDYLVRSIAWSESGHDLLIGLQAPGEFAAQLTLTFVWVTHLTIEMRFGEYSVQPLVWDISFEPGPGTANLLVRMEFGGVPEGYIELVCNEVLGPAL
jgi:hypothetical protein